MIGLDLLQHQKITKNGKSKTFSENTKTRSIKFTLTLLQKYIKNTNCNNHNTIYQQHWQKNNNNKKNSITKINKKYNDYWRKNILTAPHVLQLYLCLRIPNCALHSAHLSAVSTFWRCGFLFPSSQSRGRRTSRPTRREDFLQ